MAGIDKIYTNSYEDYKEFKKWADTQTLTFFDGHKEHIADYLIHYEQNDFNNSERIIMNTPIWLDIYLIQNCKLDFILDRMKYMYGEDYYNKFKDVDLTAKPPEQFEQNRKVLVKKNKNTRYSLNNKPYGKKTKWWLQCNDNFRYNDKTKKWISSEMYYPHNSNTAHISSIKSLIRHLRKQYLPKGVTFSLHGNCTGEEYDVIVY